MMRRQRVRELMVRVHRISPELAAYHVRAMTPSEVKQRFLMYMRPRLAGAELSVAGPKIQRGQRGSTRSTTMRRKMAGRAALNPVPGSGKK